MALSSLSVGNRVPNFLALYSRIQRSRKVKLHLKVVHVKSVTYVEVKRSYVKVRFKSGPGYSLCDLWWARQIDENMLNG